MYQVNVSDAIKGCKNWIPQVKTLLDTFGFSEAFTNIVNTFFFQIYLNNVLWIFFIQEWNGMVDRSNVIDDFKYLESTLSYEPYLDILPNNLRFFS